MRGYRLDNANCKGWSIQSIICCWWPFTGCSGPTDVDECTEGQSTCGEGERCKNTLGSYFCECKEGYFNVNGECLRKLFCYSLLEGSHKGPSWISPSCFAHQWVSRSHIALWFGLPRRLASSSSMMLIQVHYDVLHEMAIMIGSTHRVSDHDECIHYVLFFWGLVLLVVWIILSEMTSI